MFDLRKLQVPAPVVVPLAAAVVLALCFSASSFAIELRADPGGAAVGDIVTTRSDVNIPLRLDNDSLDKAMVSVVARRLRVFDSNSCAEKCTLAAYLSGLGGEQKLNPDEKTALEIPPLESRTLAIKGKLPGTGRYVMDFAIGEKDHVTVKSIAIRRDLRELPADSLKLGPAGLLPTGYDGTTPAIPIRFGPVTDGVHLDKLVLSLLQADATGAFTRPVDWPNVAPRCAPDFQPKTWNGLDVAPNTALTCTVQLPDWTSAGAYRVHAETQGADFKTQASDVDARVRSPWWYAILALLAGSMAGSWTGAWSRGRERLLLAIQAQEAREQYIELEQTVTAAEPVTLPLLNARKKQLLDMVNGLRTGADPAIFANKVDKLRDLLPLLARFHSLEQLFGHPAASNPLYASTTDVLAQDDPDLAACRAKLTELEAGLRANPAARGASATVALGSPTLTFHWRPGLTATALRDMLSRNDWILTLISGLLAILIGLATLWSTTPTWGSLSDWLVAIFTGITITISGNITLQQLSQNYQLGTIARK